MAARVKKTTIKLASEAVTMTPEVRVRLSSPSTCATTAANFGVLTGQNLQLRLFQANNVQVGRKKYNTQWAIKIVSVYT